MKKTVVVVVAVLIPLASLVAGPSPEVLWQEHLHVLAKECRETPVDNPFRDLICGKENRHLPADLSPTTKEEGVRTGSQIYREAIGKDPY